jgi:hypothetical protein
MGVGRRENAMSNETLEQRVAVVEQKLLDVQRQLYRVAPRTKGNWLASVLGRFKDNPDYDEVVRLGREFRETGRLPDDDPPPPEESGQP